MQAPSPLKPSVSRRRSFASSRSRSAVHHAVVCGRTPVHARLSPEDELLEFSGNVKRQQAPSASGVTQRGAVKLSPVRAAGGVADTARTVRLPPWRGQRRFLSYLQSGAAEVSWFEQHSQRSSMPSRRTCDWEATDAAGVRRAYMSRVRQRGQESERPPRSRAWEEYDCICFSNKGRERDWWREGKKATLRLSRPQGGGACSVAVHHRPSRPQRELQS